MKTTLLLTTLTFSFLASAAFAQTNTPRSPGLSGSTIEITDRDRYLQAGSTKSEFQSNITFKGSIDLNGFVQIYGIVQSGQTFNSGFANIYDLHTKSFVSLESASSFYLKRLYLKKVSDDGKLSVSVGAIDPRTTIAQANAISSSGWIDGVRTELNSGGTGGVSLTIGQINPHAANSLERISHASINYFEVVLSEQIFDKLLVESGIERFKDKTFLEYAGKYEIDVATKKVIQLIGDAKMETDNGGFKLGAGIQDILPLFSQKLSQIKIALDYEYVSTQFSQEINGLANTVNTGYTGGAVVAGADFPVSKQLKINGFTHVRVGNNESDFLMVVGASKSIFSKSFKRP